MKDDSIKIDFDTGEISHWSLVHIKQTLENLNYIYFAINNSDFENFKPIPTDSFPIAIFDENEITVDTNTRKQKLIDWSLSKAFEELINGLIKSLKKTYKYLKIYTLSLDKSKRWSEDLLNTEISRIENDLEKIHFPSFIEKIEELLGKKLYLRDEVLSINRIRNCFVHRYAIVNKKDTIYSRNNDLRLKYISTSFFTLINNHKKKIDFDFRKNGIHVNNLQPTLIEKENIYRLGEKIKIDINIFNDIALTCVFFVNNLMEIIPTPK